MTIQACGEFTRRMWNEAYEDFRRILSHPFNQQLASGTLRGEAFRQYLEQDILYIKEDARALALTAEKASQKEEALFLSKLANDGIELEKALHVQLAESFPPRPSPGMNSACRAYSDFLCSTASEKPYQESVAALLPCYWIYQSAGIETASRSTGENPYQSWLDTYSGVEFTNYTREFVRLAEKLAQRSDEAMRIRMLRAFLKSVAYELDFIESIEL